MPADDYDVYKEAILRVLPAAPEIPLEAPPAEGFDLVDVQICPACGSPDAAVQQIEDAEVAKCPQCQCEFSPHLESISRQVIRRISEHRQRRRMRFMERLPVNPPVPIDAVDYALFCRIVDGSEYKQVFQADEPSFENAMRAIRDYFIEERVRGFIHGGRRQPPVTREEAERRWAAVEPRYSEALHRNPDPESVRRLKLGTYVDKIAWPEQAAEPAEPPAAA